MPPIKHTALFDFPAYSEAIQDVKKATLDFANSTDQVLKRLKSTQGDLTGELREYLKFLQQMSVVQNGAGETLKRYNKEIDENVTRQKELKAIQQGIAQVLNVSKASVEELRAEYSGLKKQYDQLKPDQADFAKRQEEIKKRINEVVPAIKAQKDAMQAAATTIDHAEGSYAKLNAELVALKAQLRAMPNAFDPATGAINKNNKEAVALVDTIQRLDGTLKAADASMGQHFRNVGNYASGFQGLRNSVNQITREAPAFANSLQTGFMAISNNLPILIDEVNNLKKANVELVASGQKPVNILKQIGAAVFSMGTLMSVGITLLTLYGDKIVTWIASLFKAKESISSVQIAQEHLNKALESTEYATAIKNVEELRINVDLAKNGFIAKKDVVEQYNETIGKTTGQVKTLDEVEQQLVKNADAYIQMTMYKAAANLALEEAAKKSLEAEKSRLKTLEDFSSFSERQAGTGGTGGLGTGQFNATEYEREEKRKIKAREERKNAEIKASEDAAKVQEDIAKKFLTNAANISKTMGFSFYGKKGEEAKEAGKTAEDLLKKLKESIAKQQALLKAGYDLDLQQNELNLASKLITQEQFEENKYQLTNDYAAAAIQLEKRLGSEADAARITGFKEETVKALTELEKFQQDQLEKMRKKGRVDDGVDLTPQIDTGKITDALDKRYKLETDAENKYYDLIKNGRDTGYKEELEHLERLKKIKTKYAKDTGEEEIAMRLTVANAQREIDKQATEVWRQAGAEGITFLQNLFQASSEQRIAQLEKEKEQELTAAGNNTAAREKIEKDFNDRIRKEKIKQAREEKVFAAFQIAINTAQAIARVMAEVPKFDFGISTAALIGAYTALGAIQIAAVLSKPLPQFKKGTRNAPAGPAMVSEEGFELMERDGKMFITPPQQSIIDLKGGEKIYSHSESKRIIENALQAQETNRLAQSGLMHSLMSDRLREGKKQELISMMRQSGLNEAAVERAFSKALQERPEYRTDINERGVTKMMIGKNETITYLNNRYKS